MIDKRWRNRVVMGAVAAAALVGGGGGAGGEPARLRRGPAGHPGRRGGAARREPSELRAALVDAYEARIDAAVDAGDLTQEQADSLKERLEADGAPLFGGRSSTALATPTGSFTSEASKLPRPTSA